MIDYEKALINPAGVFLQPEDVFDDEDLTDDQKITVLRRWEYDARTLMVAAEENMAGDDEDDLLDRILALLHELNAEFDPDISPPTKQGGE